MALQYPPDLTRQDFTEGPGPQSGGPYLAVDHIRNGSILATYWFRWDPTRVGADGWQHGHFTVQAGDVVRWRPKRTLDGEFTETPTVTQLTGQTRADWYIPVLVS